MASSTESKIDIMESTNEKESSIPLTGTFLQNMIAGGLAGTSVDVALFPIDTVKTRLQSPDGFWKSGGFRGIYRGIGAAAAGSAPGASLFFTTYESMKPIVGEKLEKLGVEGDAPVHMISASLGEIAACMVRVPTEVVKSRMQTNQAGATSLSSTIRLVVNEQGLPIFGGLYSGYGITIMREIPFALIQFPLYEWGKKQWAKSLNVEEVSPEKAAICGSISGGIAAAFTTPLDVVKTRLMLGQDTNGKLYKNAFDVVQRVASEEGPKTFLSGIQPRVMWISIGGFVFFGAYEGFKSILP
mmetsp:Transcript_8306/g.12302  ORF Transcript_8306/g.12302 Transcript_8306/m.12302 type:complete len:299 (+) Transcript_8306:82-978(+)